MYRIMMIVFFCFFWSGCTSQRSSSISAPFIGTWYQSSIEAAQEAKEPAGYIAISTQQITMNVDGIPRSILPIHQNETDPSLRSGRLTGADGSIIFLSLGESIIDQQVEDVRLLAPTIHLDWYYFAPGAALTGKPTLTLRLWQSTALASASYARQLSSDASDASDGLASKKASKKMSDQSMENPRADSRSKILVNVTTRNDERLLEASQQINDPYFSLFSEQLLRAKQGGSTPHQLNELYARCIKNCRSDILSYLDQSRKDDGTAIKRVDTQLDTLNRYSVIYREWHNNL